MPTTGLVRAPARRLQEVADRLATSRPAGREALVTGVTLDSRGVAPGDLYAALPGRHTHGARFAGAAAAAGAVAVLTDAVGAAQVDGLPVFVVDDPRAVLGSLAAWLYGEPATRMTTFGVTGTNGKTTTTFLLDGALRRGGAVTGMVGTVETRVGDERVPSVRTTPEAPDLQALLARMVAAGVTHCSMEVSSHALMMGRVDGVVFDVAGFTNLSQDHLDYHATMEDYFAAKAQLFMPAHARRGVVVVDDAWGRRLAGRAGVPVVTLSTDGGDADWRVTGATPDGTGTAFTLTGPDGAITARCPLPGSFNVANAALAVVMDTLAGTPVATAAAQVCAADPVPGRMEPVPAPPGGPLAVVDYAHTPDAVEAALQALAGRPPLVVVLGAGGDRDRQKRPLMGAAAARAADVLVVTDDNPRSEVPAEIRAAVLAGARAAGGAEVVEVADRRAAIAEGVRRAGTGTLLVAGKGHERGQEVAGTVHPFDDREVLSSILAEIPGGDRA